MIIRRETLNEISSLLAAGCTSGNIAATLRIAESDVKSAIAAWKLQEKKLDFLRVIRFFRIPAGGAAGQGQGTECRKCQVFL